MTDPQHDEPTGGAALEVARREKLAKLLALGVDPWGQRFDGHLPIAAIRARENEIVVEPASEPRSRRKPIPIGSTLPSSIHQNRPLSMDRTFARPGESYYSDGPAN